MMLSHAQEWGLKQIANAGGDYIIGIDEVGVGAIAGPLVVGATVFHKGWSDPAVKDSKLYPGGGVKAHNKRMVVLKKHIEPVAKLLVLEAVSSQDIDAIGMGDALADAMRRVALSCLYEYPGSAVVIDGENKPYLQGASLVVAIPKGDGLVPAVSAASVLAKTARDALMIEYDKVYPGYDLSQHMGYGTLGHIESIERQGLCPLHRRSYKIVRELARIH